MEESLTRSLSDMTTDEKSIKIAEVCGWKYHGRIGDRLLMWPPYFGDATAPPHYFNDLNAMHEAEKALTDEEYFTYCRKHLPEVQRSEIAQGRTATAAQRAEAFGLTLGLWEAGE